MAAAALTRAHYQALAKQHGVKANLKSADIDRALRELGVDVDGVGSRVVVDPATPAGAAGSGASGDTPCADTPPSSGQELRFAAAPVRPFVDDEHDGRGLRRSSRRLSLGLSLDRRDSLGAGGGVGAEAAEDAAALRRSSRRLSKEPENQAPASTTALAAERTRAAAAGATLKDAAARVGKLAVPAKTAQQLPPAVPRRGLAVRNENAAARAPPSSVAAPAVRGGNSRSALGASAPRAARPAIELSSNSNADSGGSASASAGAAPSKRAASASTAPKAAPAAVADLLLRIERLTLEQARLRAGYETARRLRMQFEAGAEEAASPA